MGKIIRKTFIILFLSLIFYPARSYAEDSVFDAVYNIEYQVNADLEVSVKESIGVVNQSSSAIPSSFIESITNIKIYDVKVLDGKENEIKPAIEEKPNNVTLKIPIEDPSIGKDKITRVYLLYKTRDLAQKNGRILSLNIPKAPVSNNIQEYNITVKIPKDFGPQITISPKPVQEKMEEEGFTLLYNKQSLEKYGISATFGDYQIFDFQLAYELKNTSFLSKKMEIALPMPIKDYQEIIISSLNPVPEKMYKDADGNIIGVYNVGGKSSVTVDARGKAKVYNKKIDTDEGTSGDSRLPVWLKPQKFWETGDTGIKQISKETTDSRNSNVSNALSIYTYITRNLTYDYEQAKTGGKPLRKGAVITLNERKGLCTDFSDTFVALARASGVPSRLVEGYAYAKDQNSNPTPLGGNSNDLLHSWVQFYSPKQGWVSVDPTWGTTSGLDYFSKLDNNHVVFVIRGIDSQNPSSAQQVKVDFSGEEFAGHESLYDLDKMPVESGINSAYLAYAGAALALALCMMILVPKVRPGFHRK